VQTQQYTSAGTVEDTQREGLPVTSLVYKVYDKAGAIYTKCKKSFATYKKLFDAIHRLLSENSARLFAPHSIVVHFKTVQ